MKRSEQKPTHVYVARKECGCCIGLVTDLADKSTGEAVAEFISSGLTVDRVAWADYADKVRHEPGFMNCQHGQLSLLAEAGK